MLKVYQLLNIFGELSHRNKVALYKFLTDRNTYLDKDKIEEFIRLVREMEEDLMYEDDYWDDQDY